MNQATGTRTVAQLLPNDREQLELELASGNYTAQQLAERFQLRNRGLVEQLKARLGLVKKRATTRSVDLDAELEAARRKVAELEARQAERAIRFQWVEESIDGGLRAFTTTDESSERLVIYGVTSGFVKAGGMQKLLVFLEKECPQVRLNPNGHVA